MKIFYLLFFATIFLSCSDVVTDSTDEIVITNIEKQSEVRIQSDESQIDLSAVIEGKWMGAFGNSQLTIVIEEVKGFQISGYN